MAATAGENQDIAIDFKYLICGGMPSKKLPLGKVFTRFRELEIVRTERLSQCGLTRTSENLPFVTSPGLPLWSLPEAGSDRKIV
jgi:hypothetical protein